MTDSFLPIIPRSLTFTDTCEEKRRLVVWLELQFGSLLETRTFRPVTRNHLRTTELLSSLVLSPSIVKWNPKPDWILLRNLKKTNFFLRFLQFSVEWTEWSRSANVNLRQFWGFKLWKWPRKEEWRTQIVVFIQLQVSCLVRYSTGCHSNIQLWIRVCSYDVF